MSSTVAHRSQVNRGYKTRTANNTRSRTKSRVIGLAVQSFWSFFIFLVLSYFIVALSGHMLTEMQRAKIKAVTPQVKQAQNNVTEHRLRTASEGSSVDLEAWATERDFIQRKSVSKYVSKF